MNEPSPAYRKALAKDRTDNAEAIKRAAAAQVQAIISNIVGPKTLAEVKKWAAANDCTTLEEALARLVELGLAAGAKRRKEK